MAEHESSASQADRRAQIVAAARAQIAQSGTLQLGIAPLTESLGISTSLFWTYFANGDALVAAVFGELIDELHAAGLARAARDGDAGDRLLRCARIYLKFLSGGGLPLTYFVQGDALAHLGSHVSDRLRADLRQLLRALRRDFSLSVREGFAWIEMLAAIPEELGRMVGADALTPDMAGEICDTLIGAAIDAVRPIARSRPPA
ncbi:TetR/AcrR family transcriptional regulator [uncultured Croceicoccus sp.]|uniref:TetR/AcrR family transcriptional regulator n=1 Tax=uncultured Croceicoccus sp. TaxID=1295329 RepID=UPI00262BA406|nr:TetR/AcrR family transcriptional regulator [uncultured Croceicoccus sp.]